jgi:hypothetical protein
MKALVKVSCWRGLPGPVPVAGSNFERKKGRVLSPSPLGSKGESNLGMAIGKGSAGSCVCLKPRSWVIHWPHCMTALDIVRLLRTWKSSSQTMLLISRALLRPGPAGAETPSA